MTDQGAKVNTRALALDFLLETVEKGGYSHVVMRGMLEKYQYLDKKERAFLTRLCEGTRERMLELKSGKVIFLGGGATLLRRQIEDSSKVGTPLFVTNINANAAGFEYLYRLETVGR